MSPDRESFYRHVAREACRGALAGCIATLPMSALMVAMHRQLPRRERYPLPPRLITERAGRPIGVQQLDRDERRGLTVLMHFAYGAAMGTAYALMRRSIPVARPDVKGTLFGLAVWTGSYLGWLPVMGIHSATEETPRRNGLMIAAHVVYGASLGVLFEALRTWRGMPSPPPAPSHGHRHLVEQEPTVIGTA